MFDFRMFPPRSVGRCLIIVFASAGLLLLLPGTLSASAPASAKPLSLPVPPAPHPSLFARQLISSTVGFSQAAYTVTVGAEFSVDVLISGATELAGWQSTLGFDPASLEVVSISDSDLIASTGRVVTYLAPWVESPGRLVFGAYTYGTTPAVSGSGRLARIRLRALTAGTGTIAATQTILATLDGAQQVGAHTVPVANAQITAVAPLAVTLQSFSGRPDAGGILITWETSSEIDNQGFNLYRAADAAAPQEMLSFIPSQAPGSSQGFAYEWLDSDVLAGETYHYWLEDVDTSGATLLHGPVSATFQAPSAVTVAGVQAAASAPGVAGWWVFASVLALLAGMGTLVKRR